MTLVGWADLEVWVGHASGDLLKEGLLDLFELARLDHVQDLLHLAQVHHLQGEERPEGGTR